METTTKFDEFSVLVEDLQAIQTKYRHLGADDTESREYMFCLMADNAANDIPVTKEFAEAWFEGNCFGMYSTGDYAKKWQKPAKELNAQARKIYEDFLKLDKETSEKVLKHYGWDEGRRIKSPVATKYAVELHSSQNLVITRNDGKKVLIPVSKDSWSELKELGFKKA
jgi:hypothetical protein